MRILLLLAGLLLALSPLAGCDTTGIDDDFDCTYDCGGKDHPGDDNDDGDDGDKGGDDDKGDDGDKDDDDDKGDDRQDVTLDVDPRQTYLRTSDDDAVDSPAVSLTDLGYQPGETVCFRVEGDFSLVENYWASERGEGYLTAVFSRSDRLRNSSERYRVSDAVDAGDDVFTLDTERNKLVTDIGEDFRADDVCLTVPDDAEFVFFAAYDSFYGDNDRIDGTPFRVRIEK